MQDWSVGQNGRDSEMVASLKGMYEKCGTVLINNYNKFQVQCAF